MLNYRQYYDKILGCYIGKNVGGTLGAPFECYRGKYNIKWFMQDISHPIPNDDVDLQLVWLRVAEIEGRKIDSLILAEYWNTYISATLSEYGTGKNNFNIGIFPPLSGKMRNENSNSNGAWIRTEIWACLCAGNPSLAANYAYYDSCVDHAEEGVYSAVFCVVIQSAAFFEQDINKLIDIGLSYIPTNCAIRIAVESVRNSFKNGKTWEEARKELFIVTPSSFGLICGPWKGTNEIPISKLCPEEKKFDSYPKADHGFDAPWSIGVIILGLLYGGEDFGKSICLAVNCGEDTDCTAGTVGSILGIIKGATGIEKKWKDSCSNLISTWTLRIDQYLKLPKNIEDLAFRISRLAPEFLGRRTCNIYPNFDVNNFNNEFFEINPIFNLYYDNTYFDPMFQEDIKDLLEEQGKAMRFHFHGLTVVIEFDDNLVKINKNVQKILKIKFYNMLFTPQYLKIIFSGLPNDWEYEDGNGFCVGLEHLHGGSNKNSLNYSFTPKEINKGAYNLLIEISINGRFSKFYIPLTFIHGSC